MKEDAGRVESAGKRRTQEEGQPRKVEGAGWVEGATKRECSGRMESAGER